MKTLLISFILLFHFSASAQSPVGKWKIISHINTFEGKEFDSHKAVLQYKPCAAKIVWEINDDKTFRLNAANSGCDAQYSDIQQKLYSKTKWKVQNGIITTSATDFVVGQSYRITISGNKMTWVGTDGQGTITYQKL